MSLKRVEFFLLTFQLSHFVFLLAFRGSFDEALVRLQVWLFVGFLSLGTGCRCAVVWSVVFVGVAVTLDLLFLFPETMVFVVFELFREKIASSFGFCHATRPPSTRTHAE